MEQFSKVSELKKFVDMVDVLAPHELHKLTYRNEPYILNTAFAAIDNAVRTLFPSPKKAEKVEALLAITAEAKKHYGRALLVEQRSRAEFIENCNKASLVWVDFRRRLKQP